MGTITYNLALLDDQNGALPKPIQLAAAEILNAAEKAGHHIPAVSWYNPASTPEHHVPGMAGNGGVAVDFMTYTDTKLQDWIDAYVWANRVRLGVCWLISRRRIRSTSPGHSGNWTIYTGADPHTNHSHVNFGHLYGKSGYGNVTKIAYVGPEPAKPDTTYLPTYVVTSECYAVRPSDASIRLRPVSYEITTAVAVTASLLTTESDYRYPVPCLKLKETSA